MCGEGIIIISLYCDSIVVSFLYTHVSNQSDSFNGWICLFGLTLLKGKIYFALMCALLSTHLQCYQENPSIFLA